MMIKKFILLILFFSSIKGFSQNKIENYELGYYFDINSSNIDGYFDFDYAPKNALRVSASISDDYTLGYYYDLSNNKINGLIKHPRNNANPRFKINDESNYENIKPKNCKGYVIGLDTFAVIVNFETQNIIGVSKHKNREFAEVIDKFDNYIFYKHVSNENSAITTYLYSLKSSYDYISFSKNQNKFKEIAIPIFGEFKPLKIKILNGKYSDEDIPLMTKILKYKLKYDKQEKIYYNSSWDEIDDLTKSEYYAKISSIEDSVFHLSFFFNDNTLIYEGNFTSFYPHTKVGEFKWYYPNGALRKKITYENNTPLKTTTFYKNGSIHYEFYLVDKIPSYNKVYNVEGVDLLNSVGNGTETFIDSITGRQINNEFKNNRLTNSFYTDSLNKRIYLLCDKNAQAPGLDIVNSANVYPINALKKFKHGIVLAKCRIEPNGKLSNIVIIKGIDPECNEYALTKLSNIKWTSGKVGKERVTQEIIFPINFSIERPSKYNFNNNNYYDPFWFDRTIPTPTIPKIAPPRL